MGFFQELKENLSQAVSELMPEDQELQKAEKAEADEEAVEAEDVIAEESAVQKEDKIEDEVPVMVEETQDMADANQGQEVSAQEAAFAAYMQGVQAKKEEMDAKQKEEEDLKQLEAEIARLEEEERLEKERAEAEQTTSEIDQAISGVMMNGSVSFAETENFEQVLRASEETDDRKESMEGISVEETAMEEQPLEESLAEAQEESDGQEIAEEVSEERAEEALETVEETSETPEEVLDTAENTSVMEEAPVEAEMNENPVIEQEMDALEEQNGEERNVEAPKAPHTWGERKMDATSRMEAVDEVAVITAGMKVKGDINSQGSLNVIGQIEGNVDVYGKLNITGSINGNSRAAEIFADSARITGEVCSEGSVKIGQSSVIIGNITATSAVIAGAVKGDIDVKGPVILDTSAIVMGNIKSKSVQINNGAVIEGMCSQCYADVSPSNFFNEFKR